MVLHYDTFKLASTDSGCERWPDLQAVLDYWESIGAGRIAPSWADFDLLRLPFRLIPNTVVCDYDPGSDELTFRYWGTGMAAMFKLEVTGTRCSQWTKKGLFQPLVDGFAKLRTTGKPFVNVNEIEMRHGGKILAPVLRLPLSSDGVGIDGMVAVNDFGVNTDELRRHFEQKTNG